MVLHICFEAWIRLAAHMVKFGWNHILFTLVLFLFLYATRNNKLFIGGAAWLINSTNSLSSWSFFGKFSSLLGKVFGGVSLGTFFTFAIAIIWLYILLTSNFDPITKLLMAPLFLVFGAVWAIIPVPIPLTYLVAEGLNKDSLILRYLSLLGPFVLFFIPGVCFLINGSLKILEVIEYNGIIPSISDIFLSWFT